MGIRNIEIVISLQFLAVFVIKFKLLNNITYEFSRKAA